jgi:hypothetical protein
VDQASLWQLRVRDHTARIRKQGIKIHLSNRRRKRMVRICSPEGERVLDNLLSNADDWATDPVIAEGTYIDENGVGPAFDEPGAPLNPVRLYCILDLLFCSDEFFEAIFDKGREC